MLKVGSVVTLKSGSPSMTITKVYEDGKTVECDYFYIIYNEAGKNWEQGNTVIVDMNSLELSS